MKTSIMLPGFAIFAVALAGCAADVPAESEALSTAPEALSPAQPLAGPDGFYIKTINGNGTGCKSPLQYTLTPDGQTFIVYFTEMELRNQPGRTFQHINCVVTAVVHVPHGLQLSVGTINTRGIAHLPQGTSAQQTSTYFFAGQRVDASGHTQLNGFYDRPYTFTDEIGLISSIKSPCGVDTLLNINTSLDLNTAGNPTSDAFFNNETVDGTFRKVIQLHWDHCVG